MEDIQIVREFKEKVQDFYLDAEVRFYGSRARKTHHEDSDYDILVLLEEVTPSIRKTIYDIAWEIGYKYDALLVPVLSQKDDFYMSNASPFFNNVKQHGMVV